ncbi:ATP-grasp domain-containing protein [Sphingobacterium lumbrici]|uniref:glutathione synthase n=1 Tax=Sphingobacterium lumbrici TaxID=2559600 RepID=UPI001127E661|nr:glutathione synthase [Sphingobacterium lumbrici]
MKIALLINQTHKEEVAFTTTLLALTALKRDHTIIYIGLADFIYQNERNIGAHGRVAEPDSGIDDGEDLLNTLRSNKKQIINLQEIDVLWLRFDPVLDMINRPWAAAMGIQFAQLVKNNGRLVVNDPDTLIQASNKLYLENFSKEIRPKTIVTRNHEDVIAFLEEQQDKIILKPLKGSGGKNVFLIPFKERQNLKQIVEVIGRDGYVIAQEYLPEAVNGDIRFFLLDGKPIIVDGKYAAVNRVQQGNEIRSNIHQGAKAKQAFIDEKVLNLVNKVASKLIEDNMYFVGLDIVGDKIMEINVFSPGALGQASRLNHVDYSTAVIENLENKVKKYYSQ